MRASTQYRRFEPSIYSRSIWQATVVKRFLNVIYSWLSTALLVGFIWSICYLLYMLFARELA